MNPADRLLSLPLPDARTLTVECGSLYGAALSLAVAETLTAHKGMICIVAPTAAATDRLESELSFFAPDSTLHRFSDYETLPYEAISPPHELLAERLRILYSLASGEENVLLVNADALLNRLPPPDFVLSRSLVLEVGQRIDRDDMATRLVNHGYLRVERVAEPGEFAVRGAILDVYPAGIDNPVRIDLFDDEVEKLRPFDVTTQRSTGSVGEVRMLPAREFPFDTDGIRSFRQRFRDTFPVEPGRASVYRDISEAVLPAGIEYYLPLFFDSTCSLLDYLPETAIIVEIEHAFDELDSGWDLIRDRYEQLGADPERPLLAPDAGFCPPETLIRAFEARPRIGFQSRAIDTPGPRAVNAEAVHPLQGSTSVSLDRFTRWLDAEEGERTLLLSSSAGRREALRELLKGRGYEPRTSQSWEDFVAGDAALSLGVADVEQGLLLPAHGLRVVTAEQLGMEKPRQRQRRRRTARSPEAIIRELTDLQVGAPVVHEDHGIGRYRGLVTLDVDGVLTEFLLLEYADGDKLYVPVQSLESVSRYTGASPENAPLHRLGSEQWTNAKRRAARQARDVAAELLNLYAQRAAQKGTTMRVAEPEYEFFCNEFPFEETEDQKTAIDDVLEDLTSDQPMDRIVCGDVGFGKTEVALRSAFVTVHSGYQVAVLVPTTLLAQQHFRTFSDRFADWPVNVRLLSRFSNSRRTKETLAGLADGSVDIVIGTHKLLQRDVEFKKLGLIVVDEEHRFGVKQKEKLKKLRADVHILTMTATPIPRTLNMSLGGLRDLSIIASPPAERLSVKTFVGEWSDLQVREAVLREIRRGGQVYFVHNRVESIDAAGARLEKIVPEAAIRIAHGQMPETQLESIMVDFYHRRFNVLVCTTIIESGIDIPTANTIVIERADRLGLAQLHQLRGRVGRSHHQAYAYLLAPPLRALTDDARKRLEAIEALEQLGSGFTLATHDLEIRGAGELLGEEQSGQIQAIGFSLYNDLLARAVTELRAGREPHMEDPFVHGPEVETGLSTLIPEDYMPDVHMRLVHYKRIAGARSKPELDELQVELIDRFGLLPGATKNLFSIAWLKILAQNIGLKRLRAGSKGGVAIFSETAEVDPVKLVELIEQEPARYRLDGPFKLRLSWDGVPDEQLISELEGLLGRLGATTEQIPASR